MSLRLLKVESQLQQEISNILLLKLLSPELGLVTVTSVKISPDLRQAKVYVSVMEKEKRERAFKHISAAAGMIRGELGSRIRMRYTPELKFYLDDTLDYVEKIDSLIRKIHEDDKPGEA